MVRHAITALVVLTILVSANPSVGASRVKFVTSEFSIEKVTVSARLFIPKGRGPFPAVILLHTCGGLLPHVTRHWPNYLSRLGYVVLTFDSYAPRGYSRCTQFITWQLAHASDAFGALDYLQSLPLVDGDRIAVMGFSTGGDAINNTIIAAGIGKGRNSKFRAAIAFYASCTNLRLYAKDNIPLMQVSAERDHRLVSSCEYWGKRTPMEVHVLKGAYHAFDQPQIKRIRKDSAGNPMRYSSSATKKARALTKAFLDKHLR